MKVHYRTRALRVKEKKVAFSQTKCTEVDCNVGSIWCKNQCEFFGGIDEEAKVVRCMRNWNLNKL